MTVLYIGGSLDTLRLVSVQNHRGGAAGQTRLTRLTGRLYRPVDHVNRVFRFRSVLFGSRGGLGLALGLSILDSSLSSFSGFGRVCT